MFLGTYTPKLDVKGRFFLPAKFREELAEGLVVTNEGYQVMPGITVPEGATSITIGGDVSDKSSLEAAVNRAADELGDLHGAVEAGVRGHGHDDVPRRGARRAHAITSSGPAARSRSGASGWVVVSAASVTSVSTMSSVASNSWSSAVSAVA